MVIEHENEFARKTVTNRVDRGVFSLWDWECVHGESTGWAISATDANRRKNNVGGLSRCGWISGLNRDRQADCAVVLYKYYDVPTFCIGIAELYSLAERRATRSPFIRFSAAVAKSLSMKRQRSINIPGRC